MNRKEKKIRPLWLALALASPQGAAPPPPQPLAAHEVPADFTVVIDPGHGGEDLGAVSGKGRDALYEKDVTLILAQALAEELRKKNIQAVLTRNQDMHVELNERTALANRLKADIFISLHMNSAGHGHASTSAEGIETFILNTTQNRTSARLAAMENAVLKGSVADAFQNAEVSLIVKDLLINANLKGSKHVACLVQDQISQALEPSPVTQKTRQTRKNSVRNRGVKQALFYVLLGADMPSILVEAGFITHSKDRMRVVEPQSRARLAGAMAEAIAEYRDSQNTSKASKILSACKVH